MDLTKFKEAYPRFLSLLKDRGYKATTIEKYQWIINRFLSEAQASGIHSFEDYFFLLKDRLSAKSLPEVKTYLGALKCYVESGVFHRDHSHRSGFMEKSSYAQLNQDKINIAKISRYLGHESIDTTRNYLGISKEELAEALAKRESVVVNEESAYKSVKGGLRSLIGRRYEK